MDKKVFRDVSYGMYIVSSRMGNVEAGCVINTFCQINSIAPLISISLNKDNYTNEIIKKSRRFAVSIISNDTSKEVIGKFGYHSSRDVDKFEGTDYELVEEMPVIKENSCGYVICEVSDIVDCDTHDIMIAKVVMAGKLNDNVPMTYKYYHENLKGVSPKNAPTYVEESNDLNRQNDDGDVVSNGDAEVKEVGSESVSNKYKCSLCGYIYDDAKEEVKFEDLPDDWCCPLCGAPKSLFEKI